MSADRRIDEPDAFSAALADLGRTARAELGAGDVTRVKRLAWLSRATELAGRGLLFVPHPIAFCVGVTSLTFHLGLEAQLNHTVTHGAYAGLDGASRFQPERYETLALPMQSETWRLAHKLHHVHPSVNGLDPDTVHPFFRVHRAQPWRFWHLLNPIVGGVLVFECWGWDYDRFLKAKGLRAESDRGEVKKLARFLAYQYLLFPLLAWHHWHWVLAGTLLAVILRNYVFVMLQTGSSVGEGISTWHADVAPDARRSRAARLRFQVETSKNYPLPATLTTLCGGLDRHIEHHLFPDLPPDRLRALSPAVRALCERHGVRYTEYPSAWASYKESFLYMLRLARP